MDSQHQYITGDTYMEHAFMFIHIKLAPRPIENLLDVNRIVSGYIGNYGLMVITRIDSLRLGHHLESNFM